MSKRKDELKKAAKATVGGAVLFWTFVTITGVTAAGMVGSDGGFGESAVLVGIVAGAVAGLAFYGVSRLIKGD